MNTRKGISLIEILVVLAIIGALIALALPAIVRARDAAMRLQSMNNLRQIGLSLQNFAGTNDGRLPSIEGGRSSANPGLSFHAALLPYLEHEFPFSNSVVAWHSYSPIPVFMSPADPTIGDAVAKEKNVSSYAANAQAFKRNPQYSSTFGDGTSNTIALAEHYAYDCQGFEFHWDSVYPMPVFRRATFADDCSDILPVNSGSPPVSSPSFPGLTFQVAPPRKLCFPLVAQSPHRGGMLAAFADGSVRILSSGMSSACYWAAVTPSGGEVPGSGW